MPRSSQLAMKQLQKKHREIYSEFDKLDGSHIWKTVMPEGYVQYRVRELNRGRISYFNFQLAKEMGLLPPDHPEIINSELEQKVIKTFALQIINEFDELSHKRFAPDTIKPNKYMATRYLQLQHADKRGITSGDGRSIWNGLIEHEGKLWDVSSRGTGVTALAPGAVEANKPIATGSTEFGYGCGQADIDELIGAAIFSEIFYRQGVKTERVLTVIDLGKNNGIGVRAAPNLVRPAHLFMFLKQRKYDALKRATDYLIDRQIKNGEWKFPTTTKRKYDFMVERIAHSFAEFTAVLDVEYIFAWLDWDGDNVLASAGIIDYGSVRRFGLRHDQYRYDDIQRYSTSLNEQKLKARQIVMTFAQIADYLRTGQKRKIESFLNHPIVAKFECEFRYYRSKRLLYRVGFTEKESLRLLKAGRPLVEKFENLLLYFERIKTKRKVQKVADGINRPAIYNMRNFLREYPKLLFLIPGLVGRKLTDPKLEIQVGQRMNKFFVSDNEMFMLIQSPNLSRSDRSPSKIQKRKAKSLQTAYKELIVKSKGRRSFNRVLRQIIDRSEIINREDRVTGNGLEFVVEALLKAYKKGVPRALIQQTVTAFIEDQVLDPTQLHSPRAAIDRGPGTSLFQSLIHLVDEWKHDI